jgi:hypothetical protein
MKQIIWIFISACVLSIALIGSVFWLYPSESTQFWARVLPGMQAALVKEVSRVAGTPIEEIELLEVHTPVDPEVTPIDEGDALDELHLLDRKISHLDGMFLPGSTSSQRVTAVTIDNVPAARAQQSGLKQAGMVFETVVEAGITRYLALFNVDDVTKIGPVRSARPYFVDWAEEFEAVLTHAGGSDDAFSQIAKSQNILDVNENEEQFWRDSNYPRPHNLFTSAERINSFVEASNFTGELQHPYLFYDPEILDFLDTQIDIEESTKISTYFSGVSYTSEFHYDPQIKHYHRKLAGIDHHNITPRNIIVMFTDYYVYDDVGRMKLRTYGEGDAYFFMLGKKIAGKWEKKQGISRKTRFLTRDGDDMHFAPGQTWVVVIDSDQKVSVE